MNKRKLKGGMNKMKFAIVCMTMLVLSMFAGSIAMAKTDVEVTTSIAPTKVASVTPVSVQKVTKVSLKTNDDTDTYSGMGWVGELHKGSQDYKIAFSYVPLESQTGKTALMEVGVFTIWNSDGESTLYKMVRNKAVTDPKMISFWLLPIDAKVSSYELAKEQRIGVITWMERTHQGTYREGGIVFHVNKGDSPYAGFILAGEAYTGEKQNPTPSTHEGRPVVSAEAQPVTAVKISPFSFLRKIFSRFV